MNVTQAATPPAKWITHSYLANQIYWIANCELTDQPAQNILLPREFCSLLRWQVKRPSNVAINFVTFHPQCKWHGMKVSDPIFWAHVRSNKRLTLPREMFIAQQLLRNAFDIHVLTDTYHSETDWNIRHAFWIWAYTDYFGSPRTPLMSVFGVRKEFSDVNTPKTSISASAVKQVWQKHWYGRLAHFLIGFIMKKSSKGIMKNTTMWHCFWSFSQALYSA